MAKKISQLTDIGDIPGKEGNSAISNTKVWFPIEIDGGATQSLGSDNVTRKLSLEKLIDRLYYEIVTLKLLAHSEDISSPDTATTMNIIGTAYGPNHSSGITGKFDLKSFISSVFIDDFKKTQGKIKIEINNTDTSPVTNLKYYKKLNDTAAAASVNNSSLAGLLNLQEFKNAMDDGNKLVIVETITTSKESGSNLTKKITTTELGFITTKSTQVGTSTPSITYDLVILSNTST